MKEYKLNKNFVLREFKDSHYVINIENGDIRDVTEVGYTIIKKCIYAVSADKIAEEFGINSSLEKDKVEKIGNFLELLFSYDILDLVG